MLANNATYYDEMSKVVQIEILSGVLERRFLSH